jgi:hypothetical protein
MFSGPASGEIIISIYKISDIADPQTELPDHAKALGRVTSLPVELSDKQSKDKSFSEKVLDVLKIIYRHKKSESDSDFSQKLTPIRGKDNAYYIVNSDIGSIKCIEFGEGFRHSDILTIHSAIAESDGSLEDLDLSDLDTNV